MASQNIQAIPLANLLVDLVNPRHNQQPNQREAIGTIAFDQGPKLANLAKDIVDNGLNPGELPMVTPADEADMYIVLEGNRRIAALKLMTSPSLLISIGLSKGLTARFRELNKSAALLPAQINCSILSRDEARHWIEQKHTGENNGVGIVMWGGRDIQRFRGMSPALHAIELVEESDLVDDETKKKLAKISITNVERILGTTEARQALGVDIQKGALVFTAPQEEALGRLALVIGDIANKKIKVTDLDSKDQRVAYAKEVAARPLPKTVPTNGAATGGGSGTPPAPGKPTMPKRNNPDRKFLIPPKLKLTINPTRINKIYHELQKLDADHYVNCAAVMLRVFVEMSIDHYGEDKKIDLTYIPKGKPGHHQTRPRSCLFARN
jgi:hypothetical protein